MLTSMMAIMGVCFDSREVDSDGDEIPEEAEIANEYDGYRVWYSLEIHVSPPKPEKTLEITCACQVNSNYLYIITSKCGLYCECLETKHMEPFLPLINDINMWLVLCMLLNKKYGTSLTFNQ